MDKKKFWRKGSFWVGLLANAAITSVATVTFLTHYHIAFVKGTSMYPTLESRDIIFLESSKNKTKDRLPNGTVISFDPSEEWDKFQYSKPNQRFLKRIVAGPGDRLVIDRKNVVVNDFIKIENWTSQVPYNEIQDTPKIDVVLESDQYFVIGDNWKDSFDSFSLLRGAKGDINPFISSKQIDWVKYYLPIKTQT